VITQSWREIELLVVDDGSSDETANIVRALAADDKRIKLLQQKNRGVSAARNLGIERARGEYIALLDADDIWLEKKIEKQLEMFRNSPESTGLVYTQSVRIFEDGRPAVYAQGNAEQGAVFFALVHGNFLENASTPLIRRQCFDRAGMFSLDYRNADAQGCEDWDLYLRIAEHYEFRVVREFLTGYWQSEASMSSDWQLMYRSYRLLMDGVRKRHPNIPDYVFRWSRSNYFLYLANRATLAGDKTSAVRLLMRAITSDPCMLVNRRMQRLVGRNLSPLRRVPPAGSESFGEQGITGNAHRAGKRPGAGILWGRRQQQRRRQLDKLQQASGPGPLPGEVAKQSSHIREA